MDAVAALEAMMTTRARLEASTPENHRERTAAAVAAAWFWSTLPPADRTRALESVAREAS